MRCGAVAVDRVAEHWSATLDHNVGLRAINERINQMERLAQAFHTQEILDVPDVIQFDGIWMTIQEEKGPVKPDKRNRKRRERKGKRVVVLVALGFWQESGKREVLDWQIATSESHPQWEIFRHLPAEARYHPRKGTQSDRA
jgi:hypothetical protein